MSFCSKRAGMTVIEVMIVVTIIGFLAIIAIPSFVESRRRAQDTAFMNDLRQLADNVFHYYAFQTGGFPADAPPGVAPPEVVGALPKRLDWTEPTDIGGQWDWDRAATPGDRVHGICFAALAVYKPARTTDQLLRIDEKFDDGNLNTGLFRQYPDGCLYVLQD